MIPKWVKTAGLIILGVTALAGLGAFIVQKSNEPPTAEQQAAEEQRKAQQRAEAARRAALNRDPCERTEPKLRKLGSTRELVNPNTCHLAVWSADGKEHWYWVLQKDKSTPVKQRLVPKGQKEIGVEFVQWMWSAEDGDIEAYIEKAPRTLY